jgi:hypothetical protein
LHDKVGEDPIVSKQLPPIALPVTGVAWRQHFEKHFQEIREVPPAYDAARICNITFDAEELGALTVQYERAFTPVRWALRPDGKGRRAVLLDDTGDAEPLNVTRLAFEAPCEEQLLEQDSSFDVPPTGGLYVARKKEVTAAAVIVSPSIRGLEDLRCVPYIDCAERSIESALRALKIAEVWSGARLPGDLISAMRQRAVLRALAAYVFQLIGGDHWSAAETDFTNNSVAIAKLQEAVAKRRDEAPLAAALMSRCGDLSMAACEERVARLASIAATFGVLPSTSSQQSTSGGPSSQPSLAPYTDDASWLSEFALRLASDPGNVISWAGEPQLSVRLARLFEVPTLARAARFLVLVTDHRLQSRTSRGELYANWKWQ